MTLLTIENGELRLNTNLDEYTFGKTAHDAVLSQEGVLFDGKNFRQWTFEEVKSYDAEKNGKAERLVFYCAKNPLSDGARTLAELLEEGGEKALSATLAACTALTAAAKDGNQIPMVGAGGIMIDGNKVLFAPESLYSYAANTLPAQELLLQHQGYLNETIKGLPALCFERAAIIYRLLTGRLPFTAADSISRNADIFDRKFLPLEYCINGIDSELASAVNNGLRLNSTAVNVPGKRKKGKTSEELRPEADFPLEKLEEAFRLSQKQAEEGKDKAFEEKVAAYLKSQTSKINTKRTIKRNSTTIAVIVAALVIVAVVIGNTIKTRGSDYTSIGLTSSQTISAYMNGVNEKDTMLLSDFGDGKSINSFSDTVSRIYVMHKQRLTFGDNGFGYPANWLFYITDDAKYERSGVYGVTNLKIDGKPAEHVAKLYKKNEKPEPLTQEGGITLVKGSTSVHKIEYYMIYTEGEDVDYMVDKISATVTLSWKKNRWVITDIEENKKQGLGVDCNKFKADYFSELKRSGGEVIPAVDALRSKYEWLPEKEAMQRERDQIEYYLTHPYASLGF
jgi:hypothetical protein